MFADHLFTANNAHVSFNGATRLAIGFTFCRKLAMDHAGGTVTNPDSIVLFAIGPCLSLLFCD